jgi:hypothetical protein
MAHRSDDVWSVAQNALRVSVHLLREISSSAVALRGLAREVAKQAGRWE